LPSDLESNKKNVAEFYDLIINKKDFKSARRFMGDRYKQHKTPKVQRTIIEIFRLENGKISKHWDVIQEIPETSANPKGMF